MMMMMMMMMMMIGLRYMVEDSLEMERIKSTEDQLHKML